MRIAVVGLGKLGAVMAAVFADRGFEVVGADLNPRVVRVVNEGRAPVFEPGLEELVARNAQRLRATADTDEAVEGAQITFIVTPTPSRADGTFSLDHVLAAAEAVGKGLSRSDGYHVVALTSTVMPGSTGGAVLPLLEKVSGKRCGVDFGLCYNPEFIALGSVIRDFLNPDLILIGESDPRAGRVLEELYGSVCCSAPVVARMNFVNAELTKLAVNTFVTTKISYANMLAEICERLPGADADVVTRALGVDTRIGGKYLRPAVGYGGPCFPRDNAAFIALAKSLGRDAPLAEATDLINRRQVSRLGRIVLTMLRRGGIVGILGLSYKPDTGVVQDSQGVALAQYLTAQGVTVTAYDPLGVAEAKAVLGGKVRFCSTMEECARAADVLVIATPWAEFRSLRPEQLNSSGGRPIVVDCWRILSRERFASVADYFAPGAASPGLVRPEAAG